MRDYCEEANYSWHCSREPGHDGNHTARYGHTGEIVREWTRKDTEVSDNCHEESPKAYWCSLDKGHKNGYHIAYTSDGDVRDVWPQTSTYYFAAWAIPWSPSLSYDVTKDFPSCHEKSKTIVTKKIQAGSQAEATCKFLKGEGDVISN